MFDWRVKKPSGLLYTKFLAALFPIGWTPIIKLENNIPQKEGTEEDIIPCIFIIREAPPIWLHISEARKYVFDRSSECQQHVAWNLCWTKVWVDPPEVQGGRWRKDSGVVEFMILLIWRRIQPGSPRVQLSRFVALGNRKSQCLMLRQLVFEEEKIRSRKACQEHEDNNGVKEHNSPQHKSATPSGGLRYVHRNISGLKQANLRESTVNDGGEKQRPDRADNNPCNKQGPTPGSALRVVPTSNARLHRQYFNLHQYVYAVGRTVLGVNVPTILAF